MSLELDPLSPVRHTHRDECPCRANAGTSRVIPARGQGNTLPAILSAADRAYVSALLEREAHLEARLTERENTVSDLVDELATLRGERNAVDKAYRVLSNMAYAHGARQNAKWARDACEVLREAVASRGARGSAT